MRVVDLEKLLPADVPAGESVLWHGRPQPLALARRAFRADLVALWFLGMILWNGLSTGYDHGPRAAAADMLATLGIGLASLAILGGLAWVSARTTLYVITSRRIVLKAGIALPVFFNIPYAEIASADVGLHADGTGDIAIGLKPGRRIAYLHLWPHAKPFTFTEPQPMLRALPEGAVVAERLRASLQSYAKVQQVEPTRPVTGPAGALVAA